MEVDHVTVYRWVQRFAPLLADAAKLCRHGLQLKHIDEAISVVCYGGALLGSAVAAYLLLLGL